MTTPPERWAIPKSVWLILLSWGLAVLVISGILSAWIWTNQIKAERAKDRAMCVMIDLITAGPTPPPGSTGDRARAVTGAMVAYRATLHCDNKE